MKLLIIDELGYVPLSRNGAELLFDVCSQRQKTSLWRGSTIVTSNLPFDEWTSVLGYERLTGALRAKELGASPTTSFGRLTRPSATGPPSTSNSTATASA